MRRTMTVRAAAALAATIALPALAAPARGVGDTTAPALTAVAPLDGGNTAFTGQRLVVRVADAGSGLATRSARVSLRDLDDPAGSVARVPATVAGGYLRSAPLPLRAGHAYAATAALGDNAGNDAALTVRFHALGLDAATAPVTVPRTTLRAAALDAGAATRRVDAGDLVVTVRPSEVRLRGTSAHPGIGYLATHVDLTRATVRLYRTVAGKPVELAASPVPAPAAWGSRDVLQEFFVTDTGARDEAVKVQYQKVFVPGLSLTVPALADTVTVELAADAPVSFPACADPGAGCAPGTYPTPDPLPYWLDDATAAGIRRGDFAARQEHARLLAAVAPPPGTVPCTTSCPPALPREVSSQVRSLVVWNVVDKAWGLYQPDLTSMGVTYSTSYPLYAPERYAAHCAQLYCSAAAIAAAAPPPDATEIPQQCPEDQGSTYRPARTCSQFVAMNAYLDNMTCYQCAPIDKWFANGQVWYYDSQNATEYGYGVSEGGRDRSAWGVAVNPTPQFYLDYKGGSRHYVRSEYGTCRNIEDAYFNDPATSVRTGEFLQNGWSGANHDNMLQYTRGNVEPCANRSLPVIRNRLQWSHTFDAFSLHGGAYHGEHEHEIEFGYGHNKRYSTWDFGCGPGFGFTGPDVGCGWSLGSDESEVWAIRNSLLFNG